MQGSSRISPRRAWSSSLSSVSRLGSTDRCSSPARSARSLEALGRSDRGRLGAEGVDVVRMDLLPGHRLAGIRLATEMLGEGVQAHVPAGAIARGLAALLER